MAIVTMLRREASALPLLISATRTWRKLHGLRVESSNQNVVRECHCLRKIYELLKIMGGYSHLMLVGGLEHGFYFSRYGECHHPN
jgi:hypothetical protein